MSEAIFLIDLASARPLHPPSTRPWPPTAKEHCNQLKGCIRRIVTHRETKTVTTHVFDSTMLVQSSSPVTKPASEALERLDRILERVTKVDCSGGKHPAARGIVAAISDGAPEDSFSDFYGESAPSRDIYIFARVPSTKLALAAFLGDEEFDINALEQKLARSRFLPRELRRLAKRGDRVVWVNSTPRRYELRDDVDHEAEQTFAKWLLSYSPRFQFLNLQSFVLDRRIVPAKAILRYVADDSSDSHMSPGKNVDILCLEDSNLSRCFQGRLNRFKVPVCEAKSSKISLVLSGTVRNYDTIELAALGAFDTPAYLLTPSSPSSRVDSGRPCPASIFSGMMVDLGRQNRCLVADLLEVDEETESFVRHQTLLEPVTPTIAVVRRISRTISAVNYSAPPLPETFDEWLAWDLRGKIKDCETSDSVLQASPKFFETYLPTLFSTQRRESNTDEMVVGTTRLSKQVWRSRTERMLMSFEDCVSLPEDTEQQSLAAFVEGVAVNTPALDEKGFGSKGACRELIIQKLRSQLGAEQKKNVEASPKSSSPNQLLLRQGSRRQSSPNSTHNFKWRSGSSKVIAPRRTELQQCVEAHMHQEKPEQRHEPICESVGTADIDEETEPRNTTKTDLATDHTRQSAIQSTTDVIATGNISSQVVLVPGILPNTEKVTSDHLTLEKEKSHGTPSKDQVETDLTSPRCEGSHSGKQQRNAEVVGLEVDQARKRHKPANLKSRATDNNPDTECEKYHGADIRHVVSEFSMSMNRLREGNSIALEGELWQCIDHLSTLAGALSKNHRGRCDIDRIINLNLKIPKAVTAAVQEVQNKAKQDDISSTTILSETWETIIYAFEQCVWHLASSRRTAMNEEGKTGFRRQIHQVSTILTCTQFMAETASNNQPQPVSFRCMFAKLFSSVFVHLGLIKPGKLFSEVLHLFEKFEEPLPSSLQTENNMAKNGNEVDIRKEKHEHPKSVEMTPRSPNDHKPKGGAVEGESILKQMGTNEKSPLHSAAKSKMTETTGRIKKVLHSRNRAIGLARPQFARESQALRNALMSQTRLPLRSLKTNQNHSSPLEEPRKNNNADNLSSSLQAILANTVPAPVFDDPVRPARTILEKEHKSTRSPSKKNKAKHNEFVAQCVIADNTTAGISDSEEDPTEMRHVTLKQIRDNKMNCLDNGDLATSVEYSDTAGTADPNKNTRQPALLLRNQDSILQTEASSDSAEVEASNPRTTLESTDTTTCQNQSPPVSAAQIETPHFEKKANSRSENCDNVVSAVPAVDADHVCSDKILIRRNCSRRRKESREVEQQEENRRITRSAAAKQNAVKSVEISLLLEPSREAQHPMTRSQAMRTIQKRRLVPLEREDGGPRGSSNRKRRRTKERPSGTMVQPDVRTSSVSKLSAKPPSPVTRSQAKAMEASGSIQLRNRSVSCPTRRPAVNPEARRVSADMGTPVKRCSAPSFNYDASSTEPEVLSPETPCPQAQRDIADPKTPGEYNTPDGESSAIRQIAESSLERRRNQLEHVDYIPETPIAPKPSKTKHPLRESVKRLLFKRTKPHE